MRDIHFQIKVGLQKGRLFDDFRKNDEHGKPDMGFSFTYNDLHYLIHVNNILHSLISNCEVYLNNQKWTTQMVSMDTRLQFPVKLMLQRKVMRVFWLVMDTNLKKKLSNHERSPFIDREEELLLKNGSTYYGKLAIDLFRREKLLLPNTKVRLKFIRARPNFCMISYNPQVSLNVLDCSLFTGRAVVNDAYHQTIKYQLTHQPACYNFMETIARTFVIPSGQNQFTQENVFNNALNRRVAIPTNTISASTGQCQETHFNYQKFGLREFRIVSGGRAIVSLGTTNDCRA